MVRTESDSTTHRAQSLTDAIGYATGLFLAFSVGKIEKYFGPLFVYLTSTRLQRNLFIVVARCNAYITFFTLFGLSILVAVYYPNSVVDRVAKFSPLIVLLSIFFRQSPNNSLLLTMLIPRAINVHLPAADLSAQDRRAIRTQLDNVIRLAKQARAKTVTFDSPLLVAVSTHALLIRCLMLAAEKSSISIAVESQLARELNPFVHATFISFRARYAKLRPTRLATGPHRRLLSRAIVVRLNHA